MNPPLSPWKSILFRKGIGDEMKKLRLLLASLALALVVCSCQAAPNLPPSSAPEVPVSSEAVSSEAASSEAVNSEVPSEAVSSEVPSEPVSSEAPPSSVSQKPKPPTPPPPPPLLTSSKPAEKKHEKVLFQDESVVEMYSLEYANRLYHPIEDWDGVAKLVPALEGLSPDQPVSKADAVGFLVVTDRGKYAYYLDPDTQEEAEKDLVKASQNYNQASPGVAQWLAYMSLSNLTHVYYSGSCGRGLDLKQWPDDREYGVLVDTDDPETLRAVGAFLKTIPAQSGTVYPDRGAPNLQTNYMGTIQMKLSFSTGEENSYFFICAGEGSFSVRCKAMGEEIAYKCSPASMDALRDFMSDLKMAQKISWGDDGAITN